MSGQLPGGLFKFTIGCVIATGDDGKLEWGVESSLTAVKILSVYATRLLPTARIVTLSGSQPSCWRRARFVNRHPGKNRIYRQASYVYLTRTAPALISQGCHALRAYGANICYSMKPQPVYLSQVGDNRDCGNVPIG
jgi:hypothetical protein